MRTFLLHILIVCGLLMTISCGEDRTWQYEEKTQHNHWVFSEMKDQYLWADSLTDFEPTWKNFFAKPSEFLPKVTARSKQGDSWSYVEVDTLNEDSHMRGNFNHVKSYGLDFVLMTDPTGQTTKQVLRVLTVYPNSPAERAGLLRNDFICSYNSQKITSNNLSKLQSGVARTLEVRHIIREELEGRIEWLDTVTVQLPASEYVEDEAFPISTICLADGKRVAYLMCTRLVEYPIEAGTVRGTSPVYRDDLDHIMNDLRQSNVDELVLDLRLCNYGTMEMAQRLASYVVAPECLGTSFVKTFWNEHYAVNNQTIPYDTSVANLGLNRIYILTGSYTQGAAEWLIHALQHSMGEERVILVGEATKGQNVMTQEVGDNFHVHLFPVVAYVGDGAGNYEYGSIPPSIKVVETEYISLADYGDPDEILFNTAVQHILGLRQIDSEIEEESDNSSDKEAEE